MLPEFLQNISLLELIEYILGLLALLGITVEIIPIKISPLGWIGKRINRTLIDKVDEIENQQKAIKEDLQEHIVDEWRTYILDFQNSCLNKRKHTREEFTRVYKVCDKYEEYVKTRKIKNSEADQAISYIKRVYEECLEEGEFLIREGH